MGDLARRQRAGLAGRTLGYCPQDPVLNDNLTVGQHLRYFAARRMPDLGRAEELVRLLGYEQYLGQVAGSCPAAPCRS